MAKISEASSEEDANPIQVMAVYPTTAPQDAATSELLTTLREDVNPALEATTGAVILMGGTAAITADFTTVLSQALPVFLLLVVGLGFLALVVLFRSLLVPLIGAVTSLFSLAAAMGISVAVFQWGWFKLSSGDSRDRTDPAIHSNHGVRDLVRVVNGLPGVSCVPNARRVGKNS